MQCSDATGKSTAGYRDCQLLVYVKGTKLLMELQLHHRRIFDLKTKVAGTKDASGENGHQRYVRFRTIKEKADAL